MGKQSSPEESFYRFRLDDHVPADHPLRALEMFLLTGLIRATGVEFTSQQRLHRSNLVLDDKSRVSGIDGAGLRPRYPLFR